MKEKATVLIVLKPSKIHGIGCFTVKEIRKGEVVKNLWDNKDCKFVHNRRKLFICLKYPERKFLYETYCIKTTNGWWCPLDFRKISVAWYLNHSDKPNLASNDEGCTYYAIRNIKTGKELTIDYKKLDKFVDNSI